MRNWPFAVPLLWLLAANAVMQPDALRARDDLPISVTFTIYDPSDLTALALRGANAHAGRLPGRPDEPEWIKPEQLAAKLDASPPYSERYYLEYPTPTLVLFRLPFLFLPDDPPLPPAVADTPQFAIMFFAPRNEVERQIWARLNWAVRFDMAVMTVALIGLLLVLRRGYGSLLSPPPQGRRVRVGGQRDQGEGEPSSRAALPPTLTLPPKGGGNRTESLPVGEDNTEYFWLAALPGAVYFSLNRFDVLPALLTALAFACLGRKRLVWAGAWLALGVAVKVYPILFVPIVLRFLGLRRSAWFLLPFTGVLLAVFGLSWALLDWDSTVGPIQVQLSRPLEEGSWTFYDRVLPLTLGHWKEGRLGILTLAVLAVILTRPHELAAVLRRCAFVLVVFTFLAVFWSPQWILWFLPLLVPLIPRSSLYLRAVVVLDLLNYFTFPWLFWVLVNVFPPKISEPFAEGMVYVRAVVWFAVAALVVWDEVRAVRQGDLAEMFRAKRAAFIEAFLRAGRDSGTPRGLRWLSATPNGDPVFVVERDTNQLVALVPLVVAFEPLPGSELEDVPQAREPRSVTAMFTFDGQTWRTTGRAVFNLSLQQVATAERFTPYPKA